MRYTKTGKQHKIQHCSECGKRFPGEHLNDVFKCDSDDPDSWVWLWQCDECGELVCPDCSDLIDGFHICLTCLQDPNVRKRRTS